jgi:hypothetical protein
MKTDCKNLVFNENSTIMNAKLTQIKSYNLIRFPAFKQQIIMIAFVVFNMIVAFGQSSSCSAEFGVEKDRNIRSVPPDGTYYKMIITNNGDATDTYSLSIKNINNECFNNDGSSTTNNVNLNFAFLDANMQPIDEITLDEGQFVNFFVFVTVPTGTAVKKWNCSLVTAQSKSCSNYKVDATLHTFVINPNED